MQRLADCINECGFPAYRGVIHLRGEDFLLFGNDDYMSPQVRAKREVEAVRRQVAEQADETQ